MKTLIRILIMLSLSSTLLATQKKLPSKPYVNLIIDDRHVGVGRLRWSSVYSGAQTATHAAIVSSGNYVVRAFVHTSGTLRVCKVLHNATSGWGTFSDVDPNASTNAQIALTSDNAGKVWLFFVSNDQRTIVIDESQDNGTTFQLKAQLSLDPGHSVNSLTALYDPNGPFSHILLYTDKNDSTGDTTLCVAYTNNPTSWTWAQWTRADGKTPRGLAAIAYNSISTTNRIYFVLCGRFEDTTRDSVRMYFLQLTATTRTWSFVGTPLLTDNTAWSWAWPSMVKAAQQSVTRTRIFLLEDDGTHHRIIHFFVHQLITTSSHTFSATVPFNYTNDTYERGLATCYHAIANRFFLANAPRVWKATPYTGTSSQRVDVSQYLISYDYKVAHYEATQSIFLLDNTDGRFNHIGEPGDPYEAIKRGSQVSLREGYLTSQGNEIAYQSPRWIERIIRVAAVHGESDLMSRYLALTPSPNTIVIVTYDPWSILWRNFADRAYSWQTDPKTILRQAFGRFGFAYSDDGSASLSVAATAPFFSLDTGRSWADLIIRVLNYTGCEVRFYVDSADEPGYPSARAYVFTPSDTSTYTYEHQGTEHTIFALDAGDDDQYGSRFEVFGDSVFGEAYDYTEIEDLGFCYTRKTEDPRYTGAEDVTVENRAAFDLKRAQWRRYSGQLVAPNNVGQEIYDVITITDSRIDLSAAPRRVLAIRKHYDVRRPGAMYHIFLTLGGL